MTNEIELELLSRIATALERMAPSAAQPASLSHHEAFVWNAAEKMLQPVAHVNRVEMFLLKGIDLTRDLLVDNTIRFARGLPANNALLWGARGMGKSSLVKSAHFAVNKSEDGKLKLVEIHREDIESLPALMALI